MLRPRRCTRATYGVPAVPSPKFAHRRSARACDARIACAARRLRAARDRHRQRRVLALARSLTSCDESGPLQQKRHFVRSAAAHGARRAAFDHGIEHAPWRRSASRDARALAALLRAARERPVRLTATKSRFNPAGRWFSRRQGRYELDYWGTSLARPERLVPERAARRTPGEARHSRSRLRQRVLASKSCPADRTVDRARAPTSHRDRHVLLETGESRNYEATRAGRH